jgi:hypothetical protein
MNSVTVNCYPIVPLKIRAVTRRAANVSVTIPRRVSFKSYGLGGQIAVMRRPLGYAAREAG